MTNNDQARHAADHAEIVLHGKIKEIIAAEGIEYRRPLRAGEGVEVAHELIRRKVPRLTGDRSLSSDLAEVTRLVQAGSVSGISTEARS